jgi:uncharacterized membrane protein
MTFTAIVVALSLIAVFAGLAYRGSMPALSSRDASARTLDPVDGAIAIARRRVANNEITLDEFERIVSILRD